MKPKRPTEKVGTNSSVDLAEVERLLAFMQEHGLEEFEYARGDLRVRLKKAGPLPAGGYAYANPRTASMPEIIVAAPGAAAPAAEPAPAEAAGRAEDLHVVKSPIVGTFYGSPSPGAQAFVKVGDTVSLGQVLCIIEAMKLMNEIESDAAGEVARVYVENGQPVEYGQPLFAIRPARKM